MPKALSGLEIAFVAWGLTLRIFAVQGFISVPLEGREVRPGRIRPHLSRGIGVALALGSLVRFAIASTLGVGIALQWSVRVIGSLAGVGAIVLALMLAPYKEGFIGSEAHFDERNDGVPWCGPRWPKNGGPGRWSALPGITRAVNGQGTCARSAMRTPHHATVLRALASTHGGQALGKAYLSPRAPRDRVPRGNTPPARPLASEGCCPGQQPDKVSEEALIGSEEHRHPYQHDKHAREAPEGREMRPHAA